MREKIIDEMKHWGEDDTWQILNDNIDAYKIFKGEIETIVSGADEYSKDEIIESLKYELKSLDEELR